MTHSTRPPADHRQRNGRSGVDEDPFDVFDDEVFGRPTVPFPEPDPHFEREWEAHTRPAETHTRPTAPRVPRFVAPKRSEPRLPLPTRRSDPKFSIPRPGAKPAEDIPPTVRPGLRHMMAPGPLPSFAGDSDLLDTKPVAMLDEPADDFEIVVDSRPVSLDLSVDCADDVLGLVERRVSSFDGEPEFVDPRNVGEVAAVSPLWVELRERYALGDFTGALMTAEALLHDEPGHPDAIRYAESSREVLVQMYGSRIGPLERTPLVAVPPEQLRWLTLDHRAGFLLSHIDGVSTLEEILDISGMPMLDAMRILFDLLQQRVIVVD